MRILMAAACGCGLALVIAGAAGGHALNPGTAKVAAAPEVVYAYDAVLESIRRTWESAMLFGFVHVLAAFAAAASPLGKVRLWAGWAFLAGVVLFSFTLQVRVFGQFLNSFERDQPADPLGALGMVAPFGGLAFMAGWVLLAIVAALKPKA
jgi:uncharacterized membrane protein YgdD (TMEM256/DUF423 family)